MKEYNFRLEGSHHKEENQTVGARGWFLRSRESRLQLEVLLEVLVYPLQGDRPQLGRVVPVQQSMRENLSN